MVRGRADAVERFAELFEYLRAQAIKCDCGGKPEWYCWTQERGQYALCAKCGGNPNA